MKENWIIYILISLTFLGCSTSKNSWLSRGYHNLTAKYNVYFNGEQSFREGVVQMRESVSDDYMEILPMFAFSEDADADVPSSQMKNAIQKGHKLIKKHSITVKPRREPSGRATEYRDFYNQREFNHWVDDAWMMIGKAHLYMHDWYEATWAFDEVIRTFPQKSVRFKAMLWSARTYTAMGDFENARLYLDRFSSEVGDEQDYVETASATYAWFWLSQGDVEKALDYCREAANNASNRWHQIRWTYVFGQVAERTGNLTMAYDAYKKVARMNPDYEFRIHARIKQALLEGGPENPEKSREKLGNYAEEYKNRDYRDQIYYAMAQTWFWEGDTLNALTNLQLAAGYGGKSDALSGEIYRKMADIYFDEGEYVAADAYLDSTLSALPKEHEAMEELSRKKKKLAPLAQSMKVVQYEDSVRKIAALPDPEREQFIDDLLVKLEQEEEEKRMGGRSNDGGFYGNFSGQQRRESGESDQWYFYNQAMVSLGQMEFEKRWGQRDLEDNWRRADKSSETTGMGEQDGEGEGVPSDPFSQNPTGPGGEQSESNNMESDVPDRETLVEGLPLSNEEMKESHEKTQKALFKAANSLSYNFGKYKEAILMFEKLLSQYPRNPYREQTLMGIYMACRKIDDGQCIDHYGQVILDDYPGSRFARFVADPGFFEEQQMVQAQIDSLYDEAYQDFKNADWRKVIHKTEQVIEGDYDDLIPQAKLLNALAQSQAGNPGLFKKQLEDIVERFPGSSQSRMADYWLSLLQEGKTPSDINLPEKSIASGEKSSSPSDEQQASTQEGETTQFRMEPDSTHYVMAILEKEGNVDQLIFHMANFNFDRYIRDWLQLETGDLGGSFSVVETGPFADSQAGFTYFYSLLDNPSVFSIENVGEPLVMLISENNRSKLQTSDDLDEYIDFFLAQYLPESDRSAIVINQSEIPDKNYLETREPESVSVFSPVDGTTWGMIIVSGDDGDVGEAQDFLPGVTRSILRSRINVSKAKLPHGKEVLLLKAFEDPGAFEKLSSSLVENSYWQSRIAGENWEICPVSPGNFKKLMDEKGTLNEYLEFVK